MHDMLEDITSTLAAHVTDEPKERAYLSQMRELVRSSNAPTLRTSFAPGHFTASAFVVSPAGDALLLIKHKKLGRWLQPGGHIESSDVSVWAAAEREAVEETGIARFKPLQGGLLDVDVHEIPAIGSEPAHQHFDLRVALLALTLDHRMNEDEVDGIRWVPWAEIASLETDDSVRRAAKRLEALVLSELARCGQTSEAELS